jgi:hypothetical protein
MLFDGEQEDKGLFTFYREQAQHEDELKQQRRERRRRRLEQEQQATPAAAEVPRDVTPPLPPPRTLKLSPAKPKLPKECSLQLKPSQPKQRLIESVVDMGKQL